MEKLDTIKLIGQGSYGKVFHMRDIKTQKNYALKKINLVNNKDNKSIMTELQILRYHNCKYLLNFHYCYIDKNYLCIITDLYQKGDLLGIVKKMKQNKKYLNENFIWKVFLDLCLGIYYLHHHNIIHRDLKSANVFIDDKNKAYLGDYGVSKILGNVSITDTQIGTPYYMSPEICNKNNYDKKVDMWSLGCILYEMIVLDNPFIKSKTMYTLCRKITSGNFPKIYSKRYSKDLLQLIDYLLEINPKKRFSIEKILDLNSVKKKLKKYNYQEEILNKNEIPIVIEIPKNLTEWKRKIEILNLKEKSKQKPIIQNIKKNLKQDENIYKNYHIQIKNYKNKALPYKRKIVLPTIEIKNKYKNNIPKYNYHKKNREIIKNKLKLSPIKGRLLNDLEIIEYNISKCRKNLDSIYILKK